MRNRILIAAGVLVLAVAMSHSPAVATTMNFSCDGWGDTNPFHLALDLSNKKATRVYRNSNAELHDDVSTDPALGADKVIIAWHKPHAHDAIVFDLKTFKYAAHEIRAMASGTASCHQEATSSASITWTEPPLDNSTTSTAATGTVKFFRQVYGFIVPDGGGKDVLVHITDVEKSGLGSLKPGQHVSFDIVTDAEGGSRAVNLHLR